MSARSPSPTAGFKRSASPNARARSPLLFNEAALDQPPLYQAAMAKLYDASWKFDRGKNGEFLKVIQSLRFDIYCHWRLFIAICNCWELYSPNKN